MSTILIVDDEPELLEVLSEVFSEDGHATYTALDSKIAIEIIKKYHPDIIVADAIMPNYGLDYLIQELKDLKGIAQPQLLIISGAARDLLSKYADIPLIKKPFDYTELKLKIREMTGCK